MANWKKVIVSGSQAQLNQLSVDTSVNITGSLNAASNVKFSGLTNASQPYIVSYDNTTGQLYYQGTGSFTADSASYALSASYATSASYALNASTATSASYALSASYATTASYATSADNAISASYALSSSYASNASTATSASYALSASHAVNSDTASYVNTLNQAVVISGSLSVNTTTGNSFDINADTFIFTGSFNQTGSVYLTGLTQVSKSYVVGYDNTTGQLTYQTAVDNADTASFAISASYALTASYSDTSVSSSYALTASYALNIPATASYAVSASHADNADNAISASYALSASYATNAAQAISASYAVSASHATSADNAISASYALSASYATNAAQAISASYATTASYANEAGKVTNALSQGTGITSFTYDGSGAASVQVSGSTSLSANAVTKWTGDAFANSSITDSTNVTINNAGGVLIQQGGLYVTGASTFHDNVVFQGDITVQGTASFQNATDLAVADQFILLNSGSTTFQDSGFIINTGNAGNSGSAFFLETAGTTTGTAALNGRFAVASGVLPDATTVTAAEYANTTRIETVDPGPGDLPQWGGTGLGQGNMWVNTNNSDIWIYA